LAGIELRFELRNFVLDLLDRFGVCLREVRRLLFDQSKHSRHVNFINLGSQLSYRTLVVGIPVRLNFLQLEFEVARRIFGRFDFLFQLVPPLRKLRAFE
jgi:hypothetical protein